jgi:hypothetical protein
MYRLVKNDGIDLTGRLLNITWRSSKDTLGDQLDFSLLQPDVNFSKIPLFYGDIVLLYNDDNEELFRGIITTSTQSDRSTITYNSFDFAFYLNKNQKVYQFNTTVSDAIKHICNDFNIPMGEIVDIPTQVKKIYLNDTSSTIKDLISVGEIEQGKKYYFEMDKGKFCVKEKGSSLVKATTSAFGIDTNITSFISNPSRKLSIENMKNSIVITTGNEDAIKIIAESKSDDYINKYGLLQQIHDLTDDKDLVKAKSIADNLLNDLCKESEEVSLELIGSDKIRANVSIEINEIITGASGIYLVKDVIHNIKSGIHKMQLTLER